MKSFPFKLWITGFLLINTMLSYAQKRQSDKIYWRALEYYTQNLDHIHSSNGAAKEIYLWKPDFIDSIPVSINQYKIICVNPLNQKRVYKTHQNSLIHTVIFPAAIEDSLISITIIPYRGSLKKGKHYFLGVSDGTDIYFKYDCEKNQFTFLKITNWGI